MARKRMISPEIWESQDFSGLSDVAKIVFISLFSHADDEGRGKADPTFVKNTTFPYDEGRRVADIKSALSEIARSMSVQFYSVNGIEYYFMKSWERWQKVEKPSKSKIPSPPTVGKGEDIPSTEKFPESSPNIPRILPESSPTNRIEKNINKYPPISPQEGEAERNEAKEKFLNAYPKLKACTKYNDEAVDYSVLYDRFSKSAHLRETYSMKWVCSNYDLIASGAFDENSNSPSYRNEAQVVADMRGERERYYAFLHDRAISQAEKMREMANKSSAFRQADGEIKAAEIALARAECAGNKEKATELFRALEAIKERSRRALQEIGLQESDLLPNYVCKKCSDTGFTEDGRMCDCYKNNGGKI